MTTSSSVAALLLWKYGDVLLMPCKPGASGFPQSSSNSSPHGATAASAKKPRLFHLSTAPSSHSWHPRAQSSTVKQRSVTQIATGSRLSDSTNWRPAQESAASASPQSNIHNTSAGTSTAQPPASPELNSDDIPLQERLTDDRRRSNVSRESDTNCLVPRIACSPMHVGNLHERDTR